MKNILISFICCFAFGYSHAQFAVFQENTGAPSSFLDSGEKVSTLNLGYTSRFGIDYVSLGFQRSNGQSDFGISGSYISAGFGTTFTAFNPFFRYFFLQPTESLPLAASTSITYQLLTNFEVVEHTVSITPSLYMVFKTDDLKIIPEFSYIHTRFLEALDSGAIASFMLSVTLVMKNTDRYIYVTPRMNFDEGSTQFLIAAGITLGSFSENIEN